MQPTTLPFSAEGKWTSYFGFTLCCASHIFTIVSTFSTLLQPQESHSIHIILRAIRQRNNLQLSAKVVTFPTFINNFKKQMKETLLPDSTTLYILLNPDPQGAVS